MTAPQARQCEQRCGDVATVYAVDRGADGWGGAYCARCAATLRFTILDRLDPPVDH